MAGHLLNENAASDPGRARLLATVRELAGGTGIRVLLHSLAFGALAPFLPPVRAGGGEPPAIATRAQLEMTLSVMAHSLVYWVQDLVREDLLPPGAKVFAMTSATTRRVSPTYGLVLAAKRALESHIRQLAMELAKVKADLASNTEQLAQHHPRRWGPVYFHPSCRFRARRPPLQRSTRCRQPPHWP